MSLLPDTEFSYMVYLGFVPMPVLHYLKQFHFIFNKQHLNHSYYLSYSGHFVVKGILTIFLLLFLDLLGFLPLFLKCNFGPIEGQK